MSILARDGFVQADGGLDGTKWTTLTSEGAPQVSGGNVQAVAVGTDSGAYYSGISDWPRNQWAQCKIVTLNTNNQRAGGVNLRCSTSARTYYRMFALGALGASATVQIWKFVAGTGSQIAISGAITIASLAYLWACVYDEGATNRLIIRINGIQMLTGTDNAIASGSAGIGLFTDVGAATDAQITDWSAGSLMNRKVLARPGSTTYGKMKMGGMFR